MAALVVSGQEQLETLIRRKEQALGVAVITMKTDESGNAHILMYRGRDASYIVWTAYNTRERETTYDDFHQGEYDLTFEEGLSEMTRRCDLNKKGGQ